jgi:hypothetical protein
MPLTESHDCEKEYWQHCIHCVSGDPDATFEYLEHDALGVCTEVKINYPDGSSAFLIRDADGWRFPESHSTDCATSAGMYDP